MMCQADGIIGSNIYRADDAPRYDRGNRNLVGIVFMNIGIYLLIKVHYGWGNRSRAEKWDAMTNDQKRHYLQTTADEGNKRLGFQVCTLGAVGLSRNTPPVIGQYQSNIGRLVS